MPGLRSKAFTFNSAKRESANFYVWNSEDAAKAFFTDQLLERVTGLYGVRPTVEFVQIAALEEAPGREVEMPTGPPGQRRHPARVDMWDSANLIPNRPALILLAA